MKAREKSKEAEIDSEIATSGSEITTQQPVRKKKRNKTLYSTDDDSSRECDDNDSTIIKYPIPPSIKKNGECKSS